MNGRHARFKEFFAVGHLGTLLTAFLYFDVCFAVWVLNGAMAPFISEEFQLSPAEKGFMVSVPVIVGALLRFPLGILAQVIGRKKTAMLEMALIAGGLAVGSFFTHSMTGLIVMGVILGVAGGAFGVAMSLGAGWYPPQHKGLAMGIAGAGNSGAVLAVLFAPPLARVYGWRAVYGFAIVPIVLAMVLLQVFAREPPDRERQHLKDYAKMLFDKDVWVFNLLYSVTFGGYLGLTSFLPTLLHDQYGIAKEAIGPYSGLIIFAASALRIVGGAVADRAGGLRMLFALFAAICGATVACAGLPASPVTIVAILVVCFAAMGAGNGAVFQLLSLRFRGSSAVASGLVGEVAALAAGILPNAMGLGKQLSGSFAPGFLSWALLTASALAVLTLSARRWTSSWAGAGGRALDVTMSPSTHSSSTGVVSDARIETGLGPGVLPALHTAPEEP